MAPKVIGEGSADILEGAGAVLFVGIFRAVGGGIESHLFPRRGDWRDPDDKTRAQVAKRMSSAAAGRVDGPQRTVPPVGELALVVNSAEGSRVFTRHGVGAQTINPMIRAANC